MVWRMRHEPTGSQRTSLPGRSWMCRNRHVPINSSRSSKGTEAVSRHLPDFNHTSGLLMGRLVRERDPGCGTSAPVGSAACSQPTDRAPVPFGIIQWLHSQLLSISLRSGRHSESGGRGRCRRLPDSGRCVCRGSAIPTGWFCRSTPCICSGSGAVEPDRPVE